LRKDLKPRIEWLQYKAKKALKQQRDFLFDERIETTHRLPAVEGKKIVETTVRFSI